VTQLETQVKELQHEKQALEQRLETQTSESQKQAQEQLKETQDIREKYQKMA